MNECPELANGKQAVNDQDWVVVAVNVPWNIIDCVTHGGEQAHPGRAIPPTGRAGGTRAAAGCDGWEGSVPVSRLVCPPQGASGEDEVRAVGCRPKCYRAMPISAAAV